jgi:hypothetical protein
VKTVFFLFQRFNISKMAPTGYRLYLHSSRLPECISKKQPQWNQLEWYTKLKFIKQASLLSELHSIICETLQIVPGNVEETKEKAKKQTSKKSVKSPVVKKKKADPEKETNNNLEKLTPRKSTRRRARSVCTMKNEDWEWQPRGRSLSRPREKDQRDGINFLRLRSRSLQRPKIPPRLMRPNETSCSGASMVGGIYYSMYRYFAMY